MAWAEAALEEMGLAQIWVRRGQGAVAGTDEGATAEAHHRANRCGGRRTGRRDRATCADRAYAGAGRRTAGSGAAPMLRRLASRPPPRRAASTAAIARLHRTPVASADTMPPMDDMPPAGPDDFAWFDAAPPGDPVPMAEARPVGTPVAALDWDALAARVADCTLCGLCESGNTVFGVGDREADWMLIGEAPGENEDKQGEPFVGQAGKLLDNMLHSLSLKRGDNVYIANVIKCRPPGNRNLSRTRSRAASRICSARSRS